VTELSLHILDIVHNSVKAQAHLITVDIKEDIVANTFGIVITDDGCGMSEEFLADVTSPFRTTRTTRRVGMGLSLFQNAAEQTGGTFHISSKLGEGTRVEAVFVHNSIDRQPLGDMASTMVSLVSLAPQTEFVYTHCCNGETFCFDTRQIREVLGEVNITEPEILEWIASYIREGLAEIAPEAE